jgi:4-amino-4-deoxy-L-arabinose transferase
LYLNLSDSQKKIAAFVAVLLIAFVIGVFNINRDLYETTEGRYAECAREMLAHMDFLHPTLNDDAHWTKPPLTYWAIAMGIQIAHGSEWGARLYLLFSFIGTTVCVYWLGKKIWGDSVALICSLVYCTSLYPAVSSDIVSTDVLLTFFEALALLFFWIGFKEKKQWAYVVMWSAFGAAFITKGPPGLLFLLAIIPTYIMQKRNGYSGPSLFTLVGLFSFVLIGLGWYLYEAFHTPGLFQYWVGAEIYERVMTDHFKRNSHWSKIFTIYGTILLFGSMPWVLLIVPYIKKNFQTWKQNWTLVFSTEYIHIFFLFLSIIAPLIVFCISESRLPLYLLPLFVPISVIVGRIVYTSCNASTMNRCITGVLAAALILAFTGKTVVAKKENHKSMKQVALQVQDLMDALDDKTELYYFGNQIPYSVQYYIESPIEHVLIDEENPNSHFTLDSIEEHFYVDIQSGIRPVVMVDHNRVHMLEDMLFGYAENMRIFDFFSKYSTGEDLETFQDNYEDSDIILVVIH